MAHLLTVETRESSRRMLKSELSYLTTSPKQLGENSRSNSPWRVLLIFHCQVQPGKWSTASEQRRISICQCCYLKTFVCIANHFLFQTLVFPFYFFVFWIKFSFVYLFAEKKFKLKGYLIFCRDASLKPPGVRLRTLTWLAVQFNPRDIVSCEIGSTFGLRAG